MSYDKLVPEPTADTKPFWDGLMERKFRLQRCADCGKVRFYPRPVCDACYSMNAEWVAASGHGTVHSWTITHHAFHPGFKAAFTIAGQRMRRYTQNRMTVAQFFFQVPNPSRGFITIHIAHLNIHQNYTVWINAFRN